MIIADDKEKNKSLVKINDLISANKTATPAEIEKLVQEEYINMSLT
jgi:hypothetical protein